MINPEEYCQVCGHGWQPFEECCIDCGFDPVSNKEDEEAYAKAIEIYKNLKED